MAKKYIDADRLRAEIERRIEEYDAIIESQPDSNRSERDAWKWAEDKSLLSFIDTLSEEPDKSLEEAAENYIAPIENDEGLDYINFNGRDIKDAFIAGAEWQEAQMLKGAVEADVNTYKNLEEGTSWAEFVVEMPTNKLGDKVRIIIVKEDK